MYFCLTNVQYKSIAMGNIRYDDDDDDDSESDFLRDLRRKKESVKGSSVGSEFHIAPPGRFNGLGLGSISGSLKQDEHYKPKFGDAEIPKRVEVVDVFDVSERCGESFEGKFGMNIAGGDGVLYRTALDVVRSWGISTDGVPDDKFDIQAHYFLLSMRDRFLERYAAMLSCLASIGMYAEFKGVTDGAIGNKVYVRGGADLDVIDISGKKFILIKADEFYEWHKFLAEKGAKEMADHEENGKAKYLSNVYVGLGGDAVKAQEFLKTDSVKEFLGLFEGGIKPDGGRGKPEKRGNFFDSLRGGIDMKNLYGQYVRWAKDMKCITPVSYRIFNIRVYDIGFVRYVKNGKRGIYFYRVDGREYMNGDGSLKIPRRGRYKKSMREDVNSWEKYEEIDGGLKI